MTELIVVTDWDETEHDNFYLTEEWLKHDGYSQKEARALRKRAKNGELCDAWLVRASHYAIYSQMDAQFIIIDKDGNRVMSGESDVIGNEHNEAWEFEDY